MKAEIMKKGRKCAVEITAECYNLTEIEEALLGAMLNDTMEVFIDCLCQKGDE